MTQTKHTPGPWEEGYKQKIIQIVDGHQLPPKMLIAIHRANFSGPGNTPFAYVTNKEDACLIAAAPELLEALKNVLDVVWDNANSPERHADDNYNAFEKVRAAIAKATGAV